VKRAKRGRSSVKLALDKNNSRKLYCDNCFLLYLDASQFCSESVLASRYRRNISDSGRWCHRDGPAQMFCVDDDLVRDCVHGREVKQSTLSVCEGQLVRAATGSCEMTYLFGYVEAWICVVSRVLDGDVLSPIFQLLVRMYKHLAACGSLKEESLEESARMLKVEMLKAEEEALFPSVCAEIVAVRRSLPEGFYLLDKDDFSSVVLSDAAVGRLIRTQNGH
jgi:hypothetical protein